MLDKIFSDEWTALTDEKYFEEIKELKARTDTLYHSIKVTQIRKAAKEVLIALQKLKEVGGDFELEGYTCDIKCGYDSDNFLIDINDLVGNTSINDTGLHWYSTEKVVYF